MPIPIIMPKFGFTLESCDIVEWLKQEGQSVRAGDPICEVTTDKVNMEVEAPEAGTLWNLLYKAGDTVPVTEVICYLLRPGEAAPENTAPQVTATPHVAIAGAAAPVTEDSARSVAATPVARRVAEQSGVDLTGITGTGPQNRITRRDVEAATAPAPALDLPGKVRATPAARALADQSNVDLTSVRGSGPRGRVQATDVQAALSAAPVASVSEPAPIPVVAASPGSGPRVVKLEGMRKTIATRLQKSFQTAPHIFFDAQVDTAGIDGLRARLKARKEKLSVTAVLVKACAWSLLRHPWLNATIDAETVSLWRSVNVGVAVALENGLIVPVVHGAESLSLSAIQPKVDDLAARARTNKLTLPELSDGTFTISNLGMYGVDRFTAIINPPQVAILAVGRTQRQFVPDAQDQPTLKSFMQLTLSADHRVVDGAQAAQFLNDLRMVLEDPAMLAW
jgi:pyruvate dehydrogenase E2 component (dihydrolipoamide acetyltransferase)